MAWRAVCGECGPLGDPGGRGDVDRVAWRHEVHHWLLVSCAASGVPLHVEDPDALRKVAVLLGVSATPR